MGKLPLDVKLVFDVVLHGDLPWRVVHALAVEQVRRPVLAGGINRRRRSDRKSGWIGLVVAIWILRAVYFGTFTLRFSTGLTGGLACSRRHQSLRSLIT